MEEKIKSELRKAICKAIDDLNPGERIGGYQLQRMVASIYPEASKKYVETILRLMRMYRRCAMKCVDRKNSIYEKQGALNG